MSDLVGNPEDRFSCVAAHFSNYVLVHQSDIYTTAMSEACQTELSYIFHLYSTKDFHTF